VYAADAGDRRLCPPAHQLTSTVGATLDALVPAAVLPRMAEGPCP